MSGLVVDAGLPPRVARVAFAVPSGTTLAITGANGVGKSTILGLVAGLLRPGEGTIELDGRMLAGPGAWVPPHRRGITLLGQGAPLFPHRSVLDNVAFAPRAAGVRRDAAHALARERLAEVDALELAGRRPHELSGGQTQRVAIARALAADPAVLLLDEPLAAIDRRSAPGIRALLARVLAGRLAVLVTHDPGDLALAHEVLELDAAGLRAAAVAGAAPLVRPAGPPSAVAATLDPAAHANGGRMATTVLEHRLEVERLLSPLLARRPAETVALAELVGAWPPRVLAADLAAPIGLPPFDNSQMDGYAVRAAELARAGADAAVELPVSSTIAAGDPPGVLPAGTAAAIMTGAAVPDGADAVVPVEATTIPGDGPRPGVHAFAPAGGRVAFTTAPAPGAFVRPRGSDVTAGTVILPSGARLGPAQLGVLAAAGVGAVEVRRPVHALLVSTGRELQAGGTLEPGRIHDANGPAVAAALHGAGARASAATLGSDDPAALLGLLGARLAADASIDIVVTTGGVSAGAFEVVREALEPLGVRFGAVAVQPGGPQGVGVARIPVDGGERELPVLAFPGNPVSALVSFELFLRPLLRAAAGLAPVERERAHAPLAEAADSPAAKHQVRRGRLDDAGRVVLVGDAGSHRIGAYAASTLLVHLPAGRAAFAAGEPVEIWRIDD